MRLKGISKYFASLSLNETLIMVRMIRFAWFVDFIIIKYDKVQIKKVTCTTVVEDTDLQIIIFK